MSDKVSLLKNVVDLRVSPEFDSYSKVVIHVGQDDEGEEVYYIAGNDSARTLEIENPWGTQAMANNILADLQSRNFQYQPYKAQRAYLDPSAEIGDAVSVNDIYSGIYRQETNFGALMASDIAAPEEEEVEHEFPYETQSERTFKRVTAETKAQIKIAGDAITAEVTRATAAEGTLSSRITQTATAITSEVTRATTAEGTLRSTITQTANSLTAEITNRTNADNTLSSRISANATEISAKVSQVGGTNSSFGWSLVSSGFVLYSGNKEVFKVNSSGATVSGAITATSGYIGNGTTGFTIGTRHIYNGVTSMTDTAHTGIYLGTDGIVLGKGVFKVTNTGALTASSVNLTGAINATSGTIGSGSSVFTISGRAIRNGMTSLSDTSNNGVYIGTDGISLGGGKFKVDAYGNLTANTGTFTGAVYAKNIQYGGSYGTFNGAGISGGSVGTSQLGNSSVTKAKLAKGIKEWLSEEGIDIEKVKTKANNSWSWVDSVENGSGKIKAGTISSGYYYGTNVDVSSVSCSSFKLNGHTCARYYESAVGYYVMRVS